MRWRIRVVLAALLCAQPPGAWAQPAREPPAPATHGTGQARLAAAAEPLVALPLSRYEELLRLRHPPTWLLELADYELVQTGSEVRLTARLAGEAPAGTPLAVPLPAGDLVLVSAELDGHPAAAMVSAEGGHQLLCENPGRHAIRATFRVALRESGLTRSIALLLPLVARATAAVDLEGTASGLATPDAFVESSRRESGRTRARLLLRPTGRLTLTWGQGGPAPAPGRHPSANAHLFCGVRDDSLVARLLVMLPGRRQAPAEAAVLLPVDARVSAVKEADSGRNLPLLSNPGPGATQQILLPALEARKAARGWVLEYSLALPAAAGAVRLEVPRVESAAVQRGLVAWQRPPARVESVSTAGLTAIEAVELPFGSAFVAQQEVESTYRYAGTPAWIEVRLKAAERPKGSELVLRELAVRTTVLAAGGAASVLRYRARGEGSGMLEFELPAGLELVAALEDGAPLTVGRRGNRAAISPRAPAGDRWSELEFWVTHPREPAGLWSSVKLALPTAPAAIESVTWELSAPADCELRRPRGTLELKPQASDPASHGPDAAPFVTASFVKSGVARSDALALEAFVVAGGLIRGLELFIFLLALLLPLGAVAMRGETRSAPMAALPAALATLVLGPLLPSPWRPLVSGLIAAAVVAALCALAGESEQRSRG
ncbi:MAG: hypothetical protein HYY25_13315 [Candidatus Wallbacteria bacterium]|nr:hypothetical protein [Candidatus Wallbacteria bacterium]